MAEINLRKFHASAIARIMEQVKRLGEGELDPSKAEQWLKSAGSHYEHMLHNHEALISAVKEEELDVHAAWWESTEDVYNDLCAKLLRSRGAQKGSTETTAVRKGDSPFELKLEPLNIPTFDGELHNWLAFKYAFETLVHKRDLPIAYKLGKLRQAVPATSVPLVGGLYSGGYEELWQALKERYDNPKQLAEIHVARFLNVAIVPEESSKSLLNIIDVVNDSLRALTVMKLPVQQWDALTVPIVVSKLPAVTQYEWRMHCSPTELSSLAELLKFLEKRAHSLSTELVRVGQRSEPVQGRQRSSSARGVKCNLAIEDGKCQHCRGPHRVIRCPKVLELTPEKRFDALRKSGLCFNCLRSGHSSRQCSSGGCHTCGRRHNTIFCRESPSPLQTTKQEMTASSNMAAYDVLVEGIGGSSYTRTKGIVRIVLSSTHSNFSLTIHALVIPSITSVIPAAQIDVTQFKHLAGLQLADPNYGTPGNIDILLGADFWGLILEGDIIRGGHNEPHAQRTRLGWVIFGPTSAQSQHASPLQSYRATVLEDTRLDEVLSRFWRLEEGLTVDETEGNESERLFLATHTRTQEGRYMVRLSIRHHAPELGDSYNNALRQFYRLERRLAADPGLREKYIQFMREYDDLGHMELVAAGEASSRVYYIPHHAVVEKFRVVFNASARSLSSTSLNDIQWVGPTLQDSLVNIIFRFRRYPVALTADVEKMFRQILVAPEDRDLQRILWRESPAENVRIYRLTTVTYGMACSPFNAVRVLNQCALDNYRLLDDHKRATTARDAILTSFYVDDFLASCGNVDEAITLAKDVDTILSAGCFKLRKWNSNNSEVVRQFAGPPLLEARDIEAPIATVLGLRWDPIGDEFSFNVSLKVHGEHLTKRQVTSEVAQLFDPTGFLAPVVIGGKIFIQTLWAAGISWDAPLPRELRDTWDKFRGGLSLLNNIRVPRWLGMNLTGNTALYGFCDASQKAYAAVVYARTIDANGTVHVSLLTARTKVAPLKGATIPRLELSAALLLANTLRDTRVALNLVDSVVHLWSDSTVVLCWIRKQPTLLKPYVANRVRQIQEISSPERWHYVRTAQNPADCASRGITPSELLNHQLWWTGPDWLTSERPPVDPEPVLQADEQYTIQKEEKVLISALVTSVQPPLATRRLDGARIPLTQRFSSLKKLLRTIAFIMRWLPRNRRLRQDTVTMMEMDDAMEILIRIDQSKAFPKDLNHLVKGFPLPVSSSLLELNPYLDDHGIIRVGGRLNNSNLIESHRHPIILPKASDITRLLIHQVHLETLHGGTQLMLQTLRYRYWILHARQAVRSYIHLCVICRRHRGATFTQQMASLPRHRVTGAQPFLASGVDYCGPFTLRIGTKRSRTTVKTYLAIFVCMATKATHIEVVDDLSSIAFVDAFTRFISRRGICRDLYSDNATTFVGANRFLQEDLAAWHSTQNQQAIADIGTHWHFITPSAPHQGGLWEAAVKSAKRHLIKVVGTQALWYTQLHTLAARIEACLNSRPLIPLHDDPDDKYALTPGDFLIGTPILARPELDMMEIPVNRLKHWQWLRQMHQQFWQRWSEEYLSTLQTRQKWRKPMKNIQVGDIVLVRHENLPPAHWRIGRISQVHLGKDGFARNATLMTAHGPCTRAVQKLCLLVHPDDFEAAAPTGQDV